MIKHQVFANKHPFSTYARMAGGRGGRRFGDDILLLKCVQGGGSKYLTYLSVHTLWMTTKDIKAM